MKNNKKKLEQISIRIDSDILGELDRLVLRDYEEMKKLGVEYGRQDIIRKALRKFVEKQ
ncbi:MAG: hypothetical protein AABW67_02460 [Nanoarchaeota archaeon]